MELLSFASQLFGGNGGAKDHGEGGHVTAPLLSLLQRAIEPPAPRVCGSEGGPPVTAPRVKVRDGRHIAYAEVGVPRGEAKMKIVFCHGFSGCRFDSLRASEEVMKELGVYIVSYDRPGYGESDPDPNRSVCSAALDLEELADALELGETFYLIAASLGNHIAWGALKYIPHRLAGVAMLAPVINYWWPSFPADLVSEAYARQDPGDQWSLRVSHYTPWILHWWMAQSWLPTSTVVKGTTKMINKFDIEQHQQAIADGSFDKRRKIATQQGVHESYYRDMKVMFGKWDFDPMELPAPPCPVHLWQGDEDNKVPVKLQRYIASRLSWITYHEIPGAGHGLRPIPGLSDKVLRTLAAG